MPPFMDSVANLGALLDSSRTPDAIAVIDCLDGERPREYSYGELDRRATSCARGLLARGLSRGDAVAILAGNRAEFLIAHLGTMRAGLVSVPVNHRFPPETIEFVMRDSAVKLVFSDGERRAQVPPGLPAVDFDSEGRGGQGSRRAALHRGRAPLPHERAGYEQGRPRGACHRRPAAAVRGPTIHRG